ncbi:MAG: DeoR/GlpR family DNA-binding transcription regulator [Christensenella sp.]
MNASLITLRQEEIYNCIVHSNVATIQDISDTLHISQSTVRRDLKILLDEKRIQSFHGGVSVNTGYDSFFERTTKNIEYKRKIGQRAVKLIQNNDFIYIGGGSTTFEFANVLCRCAYLKDVTIVCSAMNIARCFVGNRAFKVIVPGGELEDENESMASKMTIDTLRKYNFTKAFVGTQAVNAKNGYTIPRLNLSELKSLIVENAKELILICDHTKIGKISAYKVCDIGEVTKIITDKYDGNEEEIKEIEKFGSQVICV